MSAEIVTMIRIHGLGERLARAALASVAPDNRQVPGWLKISERVENGDLVIEIVVDEVSKTRLGSMRNTVDEVLSVLYVLLKSIEETAKALKESGPGASHASGRK